MTDEQPADSGRLFRDVAGRIAFLAVPMIGVAMIVTGAVLARSAPASFGWFAYAPLTDAVFVNGPPGMWTLGLGLVALGIAMVAGWIGYVVGRRVVGRRRPPGSTVGG